MVVTAKTNTTVSPVSNTPAPAVVTPKPAPVPKPAAAAFVPVNASPKPSRFSLPVGSTVTNALPMDKLQLAATSYQGSPPMAIADNPERVRANGLLFSTMGKMEGRSGDPRYTFDGKARFFALTQNATGETQRNQLIVHNPNPSPIEVTLRGTVYVPNAGIPTDGRISTDYSGNGFRGPPAITADSFMRAEPGKNGYLERTIRIPARAAAVVSNVNHPHGMSHFRFSMSMPS
jgi:hypothetical protein